MVWQSIPWSLYYDKLIDDDDMARQRKQMYMLRAMYWYESFICVQKLSECPCANRIAPHCTQVRYGAITALNRCILFNCYVCLNEVYTFCKFSSPPRRNV